MGRPKGGFEKNRQTHINKLEFAGSYHDNPELAKKDPKPLNRRSRRKLSKNQKVGKIKI